MNKPLLAFFTVMMPLTFGIHQVQAESWKDWVQSNPTYDEPTSVSPDRATSTGTNLTKTKVQPHHQSPKTDSNASVSSESEYFSTKNPLFEQNFMASCQSQSLPPSYCQCTLKEVQNNYTFEEVMTIAKFMQNNREVPTELLDVAMKCMPG